MHPTDEQLDRLLHIADIIVALPPDNLDRGEWRPSYQDEDDESIFVGPSVIDKMRKAVEKDPHTIKCNTSCCIAGWAAVVYQDEWPKNDLNGQLIIDEMEFSQFFNISIGEAKDICTRRLEDSAEEKASLIKEIVHYYKGAKEDDSERTTTN